MGDSLPPVLAGRYRALEPLGAGGMGVVWRARDEMLGREVAIKEVRIAPHLPQVRREEMRERTMREARAAARLGHPAIVTVHDVIDHDGRPWIVMDLVRGRSLDQVIKQEGPLPPERVAAIGLAVLDALALAHQHGIMHRDVKPPNIMISDDGRVLLTDFGIATISGDTTELTGANNLVGSPGYIAPERLRGQVDGPPADLWSLGATLYTAVEGRAPFHRSLPIATLGAVLTQETPHPSRAGHLGPVLLAMLAKEPRQRPGAAELRVALQQVAAGRPATLGSAASSASRRRRRTLMLGAAAVALAVAGTAGAIALAGPGDAPAARPIPSARSDDGFAAAPDPCELLPPGEVRAVVPSADPRPNENRTRCDWGGSPATWLRVTVTHYGPRQGRPSHEVAHAFFESQRAKVEADVGTGPFGEVRPVRKVTGVGKDSFAYDIITLDERAYHKIVFRVRNLLVEVDLSIKASAPTRALRTKAIRVARVISDELHSRN